LVVLVDTEEQEEPVVIACREQQQLVPLMRVDCLMALLRVVQALRALMVLAVRRRRPDR
jgi:hypothetical protein